MAVPARLTRVLHRVLGDEGGDDLVNWMSMVDANRSEIRDAMAAWTAQADARFAAIDARFAEVRELIVSSTVASERRLDQRITNLYKWMFVFWCGGTTAILLSILLK